MILGKLDNQVWKIKAGFIFYTLHKSQLKVNKDLDIRPESIKHVEENIDRMFQA